MNNYVLLIGESRQALDLDEKIGIALSKQYENLDDPTTMYATWSKTVQVPMTANNNRIFDNLFRPDQAVTNTGIDPRKKIPFVLFHNQEHIISGYCKVQNIDNSQKDKKYNVTLYSTIADVINDLKLCTFNTKQATDPKYVIRDPLSWGCKIDRNLVKSCWEQTGHCMDMEHKGDLDYIGFIPTYQGKYPDFDSSKIEVLNGRVDPYFSDDESYEVDEHYTNEFRSYYQQPYMWVDGLFGLLKEKIEAITDYKFNLDPSWFNAQNPYWTKAVITCPSIYDSQNESINNPKEVFSTKWNQIVSNTADNADLSNNHKQIVKFTHGSGDRLAYNGERFRESSGGTSHFKSRYLFNLFAANPDPQLTDGYARLRDDNNLFIEFRAVDAYTMEYIPGAVKRFMFYSNSTTHTSGYDEKIDLGIASRNYPNYVTTPDDEIVTEYNGYCWTGEFDVEFDITWNHPYYIIFNQYARNNGDPFEYSVGSWVPRWDWLWTDFYTTNSSVNGHYWYLTEINGSMEEGQALRSNSKLTMDRIWQLEKNPFEVLLDYIKMFRLVFEVEEDAKQITLMTRDRYFRNYTIEDWTPKLDRNNDFKLEPINFDKKFFNFQYKAGKGQRHQYYQDRYDANYGSYKVDTGYDFNTDSVDVFTELTPSMVCTKKQASDQFNTRYPSEPNFMGYTWKYLPNEYYVENDSEGSNAGNSGAFYFRDGRYRCDAYIKPKDKDNIGYMRISDDTDYQIMKNEYCWSQIGKYLTETQWLPAVSPFADGFAFQFQQPKETYYNRNILNPPASTKYIYDTFWRKYMDERYSVQTKVLTCYMYLTANDFLNFKFWKFVMIDNILYMVNKIYDFNLTTDKSTKVQLVQVSDLEAYTDSGATYPYLFAAKENFNVRWDNISSVEVFSSSEWQIDSVSPWIWAAKNGNRLEIRAYDINYGFNREAVIELSNTEGVTATLYVYVERQGTMLHATPVSLTFSGAGETRRVCIWSQPDNVSVVSKTTWATVTFADVLASSTSSNTVSRADGNIYMDISVPQNTSVFSRSGQIVITNGYDTETISISQRGRQTVTTMGADIPDVPVIDDTEITRFHLNAGEAVPFNLFTPKEMKLNSVQITNGLTSTLNAKKVDKVRFNVQPEQSEQHVIEGKTADGGVVTMETMDGELVLWAYNIGDVITKYSVAIHSIDNNGYVTVNSVDGDFYADIEAGKQLSFSCTPETDYVFQGWSDGDGNASRTITVDGDINLYPIFVSNIATTYNVTNNLSKCNTTNNTTTVVSGTTYRAVINPYNWYTLDSVTVTMDGVNITSSVYNNGSIVIPDVSGDIVVTASAGWGEYDYVWSVEEGEGFKDFTKYNNGDTIENCDIDNGELEGNVWVHREGKVVLPDSDNLVWEMLCGFITAASPDDNPWFNISTTNNRGFTLYYDQNNSKIMTDILGNGQIDPVDQKMLFTKDKQQLVIKNDGNNMSFYYGNSVSVSGAGLDGMVENQNYIVCRDGAKGCDMYCYAIRARFRKGGKKKYTVNITSNGNGSISANGTVGNYTAVVDEGTQITVATIANSGYQFVEWSDGNVNPTRLLNIYSNTTINADFGTKVPANNEIWYWTNDGNQLTLDGQWFLDGSDNPLTITSTDYIGGKFVITFNDTVVKLKNIAVVVSTAFQRQTTVTKVVLPLSVTMLGNYAFNGCTNLYSVEGYDNVVKIGERCFNGCSNITKPVMTNHVTYIGDLAFANCVSLQNAVFSNELTDTSDYTFSGCTNLKNIDWGSHIDTIGLGVFKGCTNLKTTSIPDSVLSVSSGFDPVSEGLFVNCTNLQSVVIGQNLTNIGCGMFGNTALTSVNIPDSVTVIDKDAFGACEQLGTVVIGSGMVTVGDRAFENCSVLKSVYIYATQPPVLDVRAFEGCPENGILHVKAGSKIAYTSDWLPYMPSGWTVVEDL